MPQINISKNAPIKAGVLPAAFVTLPANFSKKLVPDFFADFFMSHKLFRIYHLVI
jgi:hypothetical protein